MFEINHNGKKKILTNDKTLIFLIKYGLERADAKGIIKSLRKAKTKSKKKLETFNLTIQHIKLRKTPSKSSGMPRLGFNDMRKALVARNW